MTQWSVLIVILLLTGFSSTPVQRVILEGSMVGFYDFEVSETSDSEYQNIVNLTVTISVTGANPDSPYYNCGMIERIATVECRIPEQGYVDKHQLGTPLMHSKLSNEYKPEVGRWVWFRTALLVTFPITLQKGENTVIFTVETETDLADSTTNSTRTTTVSESASFNYFVKTGYTSTSILGSFSLGAYFTAVSIAVVLVIASTKILPKEIE